LKSLSCAGAVLEDSNRLQVFENSDIQSILEPLRTLCSDAEACLETHWAKIVTTSADSEEAWARLKEFPYYRNYEELARMELCTAISTLPVFPRKIAFIGSGPLPLTSLCLLDLLDKGSLGKSSHGGEIKDEQRILVANIDWDESALSTSAALCSKLGQKTSEMMHFHKGSAASLTINLHEFDLVYLAALVGTSQAEKEILITDVAAKMRKDALLIIRSSWGLRGCLYPVRKDLHQTPA